MAVQGKPRLRSTPVRPHALSVEAQASLDVSDGELRVGVPVAQDFRSTGHRLTQQAKALRAVSLLRQSDAQVRDCGEREPSLTSSIARVYVHL